MQLKSIHRRERKREKEWTRGNAREETERRVSRLIRRAIAKSLDNRYRSHLALNSAYIIRTIFKTVGKDSITVIKKDTDES